MTNQEHALMIGLLAMLLESNRALADVLKSRGVLEDDDDLRAFALSRPHEARQESVRTAQQLYANVAKACGIDVEALGLHPTQ
jgi:hypothetical protein